MSAVSEFAERIADYVETANTYASWDKRRAMVEAVRVACEEARDDMLRAIGRTVTERAATTGMTDEERRAFREEGVMPVGWRWCPDCNGEGRISTMDANPDLTEHEFDCETCVAEQGIVPDAS